MAKHKFHSALSTLKAQICKVGGKEFSLKDKSNQWPLHTLPSNQNATPQDIYTANAMQALWNIADVLERAINHSFVKSGQISVLLPNKGLMTKWFDFLEPKKSHEISPEDGTLRVFDDTTYQLGLALYEFYKVAVVNETALNYLTNAGIDPFIRIKNMLKIRLEEYAAIVPLDLYTQKLNSVVEPLELAIPADIIDTTDPTKQTYIIALNESNDEASDEANLRAYSTLITHLEAYGQQLLEKKHLLKNQIDNVDNTHPLPSEATSITKSKFIAVRDDTKQKLLQNQQAISTQQQETNRLIQEAKAQYQIIADRNQQDIAGVQNAKLHELTARIEETTAIADASLMAYQTQKQLVDQRPPTADLAELTLLAEERRGTLNAANKILANAMGFVKSKQSLNPALPTEKSLISALEYTEPNDIDAIIDLRKKIETISKRDLISKTYHKKTDTAHMKQFINLITAKLEQIKVELAVDIKESALIDSPVLGALQRRDAVNLHTIQKQYELAYPKELLFLSELKSHQDAIEHKQAHLNLLITVLEFRLSTILSQQRFLETLLALPNSTFLNRLDENKEAISQLKTWFESTSDTQPQSSQALVDTINDFLLAHETERLKLKLLYDNPKVPLAQAITDKETLLNQEYDQLLQKNNVAEAKYKGLQESIKSLELKEKTVQLDSLTALVTYSTGIVAKITATEKWTAVEKEQTVKDIKLQLQELARSDSYFTTLADDGVPSLARINEQRLKLSDATKRLAQKPTVALSELATPAEKLSHIQLRFFSSDSKKIGGVFGEYLKERHNTFWFRDFMSQLFAFILRFFKTERSTRTTYIDSLKKYMVDYNVDAPKPDVKLEEMINKGLTQFKPRSSKTGTPKYEMSLHAKLTTFQKELLLLNSQVPKTNPVVEPAADLSTAPQTP